jgi:alpha-L-arabinofuranosidase
VQQTKIEPVPDFAAVAGMDEKKGELVVKIVNGAETPRSLRLGFRRGEVAGSGRAQVMAGSSLDAENSLDKPRAVAPRWSSFRLGSGGEYSAPARSVNILRLKVQ